MVESEARLQEALRWWSDVIPLNEHSSPMTWRARYTFVD